MAGIGLDAEVVAATPRLLKRRAGWLAYGAAITSLGLAMANRRAYIDEILVHELPQPGDIKAEMFIRGTDEHIALSFVRIQPFISPKIELSDQRQERVDLRVLGWALRVYKNFVPVQQIERVHEQLSDMLDRETDLANEARMIDRMAANFVSDPDVLLHSG